VQSALITVILGFSINWNMAVSLPAFWAAIKIIKRAVLFNAGHKVKIDFNNFTWSLQMFLKQIDFQKY
jgi:hypothetical protein